MLAVGHFEAGRGQLRPGELILVSAGADRPPRHGGPPPSAGHSEGAGAHVALVMVSENARGIPVEACMVH